MPSKRPKRTPWRKRYLTYMHSEAWAMVKMRYRVSQLPQVCAVCRDPVVDLHHRTYERFGHEYLADLVPLCRKHHKGVHAFQHRTHLELGRATSEYVARQRRRQ